MFDSNINLGEVETKIARLINGTENNVPLMRILSADMHDEVEENFAQQGRPKWLGLSRATLENRVLKRARRKGGTLKSGRVSKTAAAGAKILQNTGQLASSISQRYNNYTAIVGTNKVQAAMMHFGGLKSKYPHLWGDIPARPFMSISPSGEEKLLSHTVQYLRNFVR